MKIESAKPFLMTEVKDPTLLWHFHYGHLNFGGLKTLHQKNMVTGLPQIVVPPSSQVCEECVVGNNIVLHFLKESHGEQKMFLS